MRPPKCATLLPFCFPLLLLWANQGTMTGGSKNFDFLVDPSKPYVYLELDRVGPRTPLRKEEPKTGIWLRLKNNCNLPIVIVTFRASPKNEGGVTDEVVPNPRPPGSETASSGIGSYEQGAEDLADIFLSPNSNEAEVRGVEEKTKREPRTADQAVRAERPHGYNNGYEPGTQVLTVIPPGGQLPFSLPSNHVSKTWHFEIPFRLALPNKSGIRPPYSYVAFYQQDLKEEENIAPAAPTVR